MLTAKRVYAMLDNETLWDAAMRCHRALADANLSHAILGGAAVCLHGYQRNTVNVDLLICPADSDAVRSALATETGFRTDDGITIQVQLAGDRAGAGTEVVLPDPSDARVTMQIEELPVLTLAKLIESKIACGMGSLRRTHKDYADVVELIVCNRLSSSFARYLHKSLRATYRELVRMSRG